MTEAEIRAIVEKVVSSLAAAEQVKPANASKGKKVALGCDHGGFEMKQYLLENLRQQGHTVLDCGTFSKDAVDYPDFAAKVARSVAQKENEVGIIIDGAGIGSSMAANKIKGIRAALCYNEKTILNSRLHNDANVLTLGASYHEKTQALELALLWLKTDFEGGRHQPRIDKMMALEDCNCKK